MPKLRVETRRDATGRIDQLRVLRGKGKRPIDLAFEYGADKYLRAIDFNGRAKDLPTLQDIAKIVNDKFMERIGIISKVELIDLITEITTITTINTIKSIESADIRTGLLRNPSFETGSLSGWRVNFAGTNGSYSVTDTIEGGLYLPHTGSYVLKLTANNPAAGIEPEIGQVLPRTPVEYVDYIHFFWLQGASRVMCCDVYYTDDTYSTFEFTASAIWVWKQAIILGTQLTAGKRICKIGFFPKSVSPLNDGASFYVDDPDIRLLSPLSECGFGTVLPFSITATGDLKTPTAGKKLAVMDFFYYSSVDGVTELRFKTSGNLIGGLPSTGTVGFNKVRLNFPLGATNELIEGYLSAAGTMKGYFTYVEVA